MKGSVKRVCEKGYAFITGEDGADYFAHCSSLVNAEFSALREGNPVTFDSEPGKDGKGPRATNIRLV